MSRPHREPGPDHPIDVAPAAGLTRAVSPNGRVIAASSDALMLSEADYPAVTYFPSESVDPSALTPTATKTWCPYKSEASYDAVLGVPDKAWRYYDPSPAVAPIAGHVAFYPDAAESRWQALPTLPGEAEEVLRFWFDELPPEKHFAQDDEIDAAIRQRFADLHAEASKSGLDWAGSPRGALAVLLLLDQFSRNLFRESPRAFENDAAALDLARRLVADGFDLALPRAERAFVYLPFMHSERMEDQNACVALYRDRLPGSMNLPFALEHREEIHRYGRFRGRDAALGR